MKRTTRGTTGFVGHISAPLSYPPVDDVVDPVLGAEEVPACPGLDPVGTVYAVGHDRERWTLVAGGDLTWRIEGPDGRQLGGRPANEHFLREGARLMYVPGRTPRVRAHIGAPLVWVDGQATLFARRAA